MIKKALFLLIAAATLFTSPAVALFSGIIFTLFFSPQFESKSRKTSKYLLQVSVVGLGFGMNLIESIKSSYEGMLFTICSVVLVMATGILLYKWLKIDKTIGYLISSGTAICGGSAIAAIAPVIKANGNQISMAMAVVFTLNAIAMFIFPPIGHLLGLSQQEFGTWAAIAIHDTSSVVGAGKMYGEEALKVATTIKLTRALWVIPLSIVSSFIFKNENGGKKSISIPWFIVLFIFAMIINTYFPINETLSSIIYTFSHKSLSLTLFLIGSTLSISSIKKVGSRPIIMGVILWILISVVSLSVILLF
ncbi:MAG: putative sulfate exporter family transporter [Bacteroidetes bacterium]|nr:putative sulfate exporter family transporter [Bacteroidota bacterium]